MLVTAEDVGKFLRTLKDAALLNANEKENYESLYEFNNGGLISGYQYMAVIPEKYCTWSCG